MTLLVETVQNAMQAGLEWEPSPARPADHLKTEPLMTLHTNDSGVP